MKDTINSVLELIENQATFVVYRYPLQEFKIIIQRGTASSVSDFKSEGFYFNPFPNSKNQAIFIRPDIHEDLFSWDGQVEHSGLANHPVIEVDASPINKAQYQQTLTKLISEINTGHLEKLVFSRIIRKEVHSLKVLISNFLKSSREKRSCLDYLAFLPSSGLWIGNSPERLVKVNNQKLQTIALAGTRNGGVNPETQWSAKDRDEHQYVSDHIEKVSHKVDLELAKKHAKETIRAGSVQHISQAFEFKADIEKNIAFLSELHPTPAVLGTPRNVALHALSQYEKHDRSYYAGFFGYVKDENDFEFYVNLRCMRIQGNKADIFVGGGITKDSDPESEWQETQDKSKSMALLLEKQPIVRFDSSPDLHVYK